MDQYWGIPGDEGLYESTEAQGGAGVPNPLVQLDPGLFIWTILTFLILFFVLSKFAWKPLLTLLESRENTIKSSLEDAEKAKQELERLNTESEAIISEARSEAQSIRVEAKSAAEKIKADIMAQAGEDAKKVRDETEKQIQVEKDKAISEVRQEVVGLAITVAEKVIRKNLSKEDNQDLIEDSLKNLKGYDA
ncbi:MAG: F0F1 ATP synthase subunit B [Candidatus Neomarinimicrobiota bacterium]|nr:ATP synthase F0 subunit B [Candidatus Neomarinimicrobiota bacterium]MEC7736218.1 F0F1 ATP synthase subunit B [Candidatus Neomarinimicrobiota bacterium]|tara:strand:- start:5582 stop:6157 length:576 start_codon:yes stop_codon:yes gene_type:complete